jgi:cellulose synthase/poly-beta-1,6-N-acetylglucosamine synthase-like glycosyltransferase
MKKGIYYVPLFIIILFIMGGTMYIGDRLSFVMSTLAMVLLCEIYYLRFLK